MTTILKADQTAADRLLKAAVREATAVVRTDPGAAVVLMKRAAYSADLPLGTRDGEAS